MYSQIRVVNKIMKMAKIPQNQRAALLKPFIGNISLPFEKDALCYLKKINSFPKGTSLNNKAYCKKIKYNLAIIVPAYNVEKFILPCIESIINQKTTYSFQLIIVDDGSTDNTSSIIKKIGNKNRKFVKIIKENNKGFSGARNTGLSYVDSEYVAFVDSDDIISPTFVDNLLDVAYKDSADIVEGSYQKFNDSGNMHESVIHDNTTNVDPYNSLYGYPWGKVYKMTLFTNVQFPEGFWYEDTVGMYRIWSKAKRVSTIATIVYYYRNNRNGITFSSRGKEKAIDSIYVTEQLLRDCKTANEKLTQSLYDFTLYQMIMNFYRIRPLNKLVLINSFTVMAEILEKYFPSQKFSTNNSKLKVIEEGLRYKDYKLFVSYCLSL